MSTVTGATAGCTLQYTIEIMDYPLSSWVQVTQANTDAATGKYKFIVSAAALDDPTTNTLDVQTVDFTAWGNTTH